MDSSNGIGILVRGSASIGGSSVGDRNLLSGNDGAGAQLKGFAFGLLNNLIGTNADGEPVLGNGTGILISVSGAISSIGGSSSETANVIAGNVGAGIRILPTTLGNTSIAVNSIHDNGGLGIDLGGDGVTANDEGDVDSGPNELQNFPVLTFARANAATVTVEGCFVGTDESGTQQLGNGGFGILLAGASGAAVGGPHPAQRNIVSGNAKGGIADASLGGFILNNIVGGDATGAGNLGNDAHGVDLLGAGSTVGSEDPAAGNVIRANALAGIRVGAGVGHQILANSIAGNAGLGIDLAPEDSEEFGVDDNDIDDVDGGANDRQNFPEILGTSSLPGSFKIDAKLDVPSGTAGATYTVRFFANTTCDSSGHGEGEFFLGAADVVLSDGSDEFLVDLPVSVKENAVITATATDAALGNTSEFSECFGGVVVPSDCGDASGDGDISAPDALTTLKAAVGTAQCELCRCDVNSANGITTSDALLVLKSAVGQAVSLVCEPCT